MPARDLLYPFTKKKDAHSDATVILKPAKEKRDKDVALYTNAAEGEYDTLEPSF